MSPLELELAFRMLRLDQRLAQAATCIAVCYKGIRVRRALRELLAQRKKATLFIQAAIKIRVLRRIKFDKQRNTLVEPYLPNHEIGIVHFAGKNNDKIRNDKNFVSQIETLDGEIIDKKLRFNN